MIRGGLFAFKLMNNETLQKAKTIEADIKHLEGFLSEISVAKLHWFTMFSRDEDGNLRTNNSEEKFNDVFVNAIKAKISELKTELEQL